MTHRRALSAGTALAAGLLLLSGCTDDPVTLAYHDSAVPAGSFRLVAFNSCDDALGKLKEAAKQYVGPWGFGGYPVPGARAAAGAPGAPGAAADSATNGKAMPPTTGGTPDYSGTNTHEVGVDEPDLVKTDGRRILTINRGVLRVVDTASRRMVGAVDLRTSADDPVQWGELDLLLQGDRALVLVPGTMYGYRGDMPDVVGRMGQPAPTDPRKVSGARILSIDLSGGTPSLAGSYTMDGQLLDARQSGSIVRVVMRSGPRLMFPYVQDRTDAQRLAANKAIIDAAGPDEWLPRYEITNGDTTTRGRVDCAAIARPETYSGTAMVSVLTFDLGRSILTNGDPVTVVADGDIVYSNGSSLYLANDQRWRVVAMTDGVKAPVIAEKTELYKFDTGGTGRPRYVASGAVDGHLINQYAMSEWDSNLRVATTVGNQMSTVYVLRQQGKELTLAGKVSGLGKNERIYAVRFVGPIGYVVTFRQTDPLYTVDLHNPAAPKVLGELKIPGYSAYLHPVGDDRLIGVGQEATDQGRVQGTQVSLFDVSDLTKPDRIAQFHLQYGHSEAEFDPHAFLYWPATGLLVVPVNVYSGRQPDGGALVLKVTANGITQLGTISHPWLTNPDEKLPGQIRRSLVVGSTLWTVSGSGLKANDLTTLDDIAWIPWR